MILCHNRAWEQKKKKIQKIPQTILNTVNITDSINLKNGRQHAFYKAALRSTLLIC